MIERAHIIRGGIAVGVLGLMIHFTCTSWFRVIAYTISTGIGVSSAFYYTLFANNRIYQPDHSSSIPKHFPKLVAQRRKAAALAEENECQPQLISKSVDGVIGEIMDLFIRDFVITWYSPLVTDSSSFVSLIRKEMWVILENFKQRIEKIDDVKLLTQDFVIRIQSHFHSLRLSTSPGPDHMTYKLYPFLQTEEEELNHLRKLAEFLLVLLLPTQYSKLQPLRHLLRELIAKFVLFQVIDLLSDPNYINQKLLEYLQWQNHEVERNARTYTFAETYEDFIRIINSTNTVEELKGLRLFIVAEMMQASAITNLKRSRGLKVDKEYSPQMTTKGELLQSRNLRQYINQLRFAKWTCEKRIKYRGGPDYLTPSIDTEFDPEDEGPLPGRKVLALSVILESPHCREYLAKYLEKEESHSLVRFWEAVEDMKQADKTLLHQLANQICQTYLNNNSIKLSKTILKGMKAFLLANKGPEDFFVAQKKIYKQIDDKFYPSFIVSNIYNQMMLEAEKKGIDFSNVRYDIEEPEEVLEDDEKEEEEVDRRNERGGCISDLNRQNQLRLLQLEDKYKIKLQALQAMLRTNKTEKSKMVEVLEQQVEDIGKEKRDLESFISSTVLWIQHLGEWKATIQSLEVVKEEDKQVVYTSILVHCRPDLSWVVVKPVSAFHSLQTKLIMSYPSLRRVELPSATKPRFKNYDTVYLEKMKAYLQNFMTIIMNEEKININEHIHNFLSASPDYIKNLSPKKTSKLSFLNFFKSSQSNSPNDPAEEDDDFMFLEDPDREDRKDSIAESLYLLIGEVFELTGVFNWVRRTIITIVQVTFGKTINRQIRESVSWLSSEPMVLFYVQQLRDNLWPNGQLMERTVCQNTDFERIKEHAKQHLLSNIPEVVSQVIGQQNARKGIIKILDALQNKTLNKHLLYSLLEACIYDFAPELTV